MSATICYEQLDPAKKTTIPVDLPSQFIEWMTRAFGWPAKVRPCEIDVLRGLEAAYGIEEDGNPYTRLIQLVEEVGDVRVWSEA